jgi:hypothetical protein
VSHRVVRAVGSITLSLVVMGLVAYGFGRVTHTEWVWWLAPLAVGFDAILFRARALDSAALPSTSGPRICRDPGAPIYLVLSVLAAGVAAWAAYIGNRPVIIIGAAFAILGRAFDPR